MKTYKIEIFTKGQKLAITFTAEYPDNSTLVDTILEGIELHEFVTFYEAEDSSISIRKSEIELMKVTRI
jgi:hypothetical protein